MSRSGCTLGIARISRLNPHLKLYKYAYKLLRNLCNSMIRYDREKDVCMYVHHRLGHLNSAVLRNELYI